MCATERWHQALPPWLRLAAGTKHCYHGCPYCRDKKKKKEGKEGEEGEDKASEVGSAAECGFTGQGVRQCWVCAGRAIVACVRGRQVRQGMDRSLGAAAGHAGWNRAG